MNFLIGIFVAILVSFFVYIIYAIVNLINKKETSEVKKEAEEAVNSIQNQIDYDVFKLLYKNIHESTEYYIISKRQANKSFIAAIGSCFLGIAIYIGGFIVVVFLQKDVTILSTVSGTVVEVIAGLNFGIYDKCLKQLNEYHNRLCVTEKYLTSIQIADKMDNPAKEEMYKWLIQNK